ncbi:RNA polymerase sigma factor [Metabacillus arenae]|uniref:RNA polymerase sigma factor n=1 Tax=Metabacillus arenae TaxID=2771434 RepID=A0A926NNG5_9BACI|nr:RNA polymerase sigma factor [Metabacillus arenae]MBD1381036.1 RNA polymerase sigma factor [Metabacillus arenae]
MKHYALNDEMSEYLKFIYRYLLQKGASKHDAEDIIQETIYRFLSQEQSNEIRNVNAWFFKVALNQFYDTRRNYDKQRKILLKHEINRWIEEQTPEASTLKSEESQDIHSILNKLKPRHKQFLLLKYTVGLKLTEIAELFQLKVSSTKTILHRARQEFIKEYAHYQKING